MVPCYFPCFIYWQFLYRVASHESYVCEKVNLLLRKELMFSAIKRPYFLKTNKSNRGRNSYMKSTSWVCNSSILQGIQHCCAWHLIESVPFQVICEIIPLSFSQSYFPFSAHANPSATVTTHEKHISLCPRYFPNLTYFTEAASFSRFILGKPRKHSSKRPLDCSSHQRSPPNNQDSEANSTVKTNSMHRPQLGCGKTLS